MKAAAHYRVRIIELAEQGVANDDGAAKKAWPWWCSHCVVNNSRRRALRSDGKRVDAAALAEI